MTWHDADMRSMKTAHADSEGPQTRNRPGCRASGRADLPFDTDLSDLRRRCAGASGWTRRSGDFASPSWTRQALARLVGRACNLDDLLADIRHDLRARPYELVHVAGGYQLRTKARYADAIRVLNNGARDAGPPELTPTELLTVTAIAYLQPATRAELSQLAGKEISRDDRR
jgi:hypothetical protein